MLVIRNPEITKNTSTPTKPPENPGRSKWKNITGNTAIARSPSISALYFNFKFFFYFCFLEEWLNVYFFSLLAIQFLCMRSPLVASDVLLIPIQSCHFGDHLIYSNSGDTALKSVGIRHWKLISKRLRFWGFMSCNRHLLKLIYIEENIAPFSEDTISLVSLKGVSTQNKWP